ncbi:MAG: N-acetylmuramoyl-L-alanine amidase-like domain-containing protein [Bacteroidota bacterium]
MNRRSFLKTIPLAAGVPAALGSSSLNSLFFADDEDALICAKKFELALSLNLRKKPIDEVIVEIGKSFLGVAYVAHSLEVPGEERLVVNLRGLDCVLFCENSLSLARCVKKSKMTFEAYKAELQFIRYRGGTIDRYPSRLHYFSDYIYDNEKKEVLKDITKLIGGVPYTKTINFMSTHVDSYPQLKEHPEFVKIIERQEAEITKRDMYHIPKTDVDSFASRIKNGDLIAITCDIQGMDIAHTGIAIWQNDQLHFMHAPIVGQKVMITEKTLAQYLAGNRKQLGIMVARALEPA